MDYKDGMQLLACFKFLGKPRQPEDETEQDFLVAMENLSMLVGVKGKFKRMNEWRAAVYNICVDHYNQIQERDSPPAPKP